MEKDTASEVYASAKKGVDVIYNYYFLLLCTA